MPPAAITTRDWEFEEYSLIDLVGGGTFQQGAHFFEKMNQGFLVFFTQIAEQTGDATNVDALILDEGFFAGFGEADVDFSLVVGIDSAANQRPLPRFQGANDA